MPLGEEQGYKSFDKGREHVRLSLAFFLSGLNIVRGTTVFLAFFLSLCRKMLCCNISGHLFNLLKHIYRIQLKNDSFFRIK